MDRAFTLFRFAGALCLAGSLSACHGPELHGVPEYGGVSVELPHGYQWRTSGFQYGGGANTFAEWTSPDGQVCGLLYHWVGETTIEKHAAGAEDFFRKMEGVRDFRTVREERLTGNRPGQWLLREYEMTVKESHMRHLVVYVTDGKENVSMTSWCHEASWGREGASMYRAARSLELAHVHNPVAAGAYSPPAVTGPAAPEPVQPVDPLRDHNLVILIYSNLTYSAEDEGGAKANLPDLVLERLNTLGKQDNNTFSLVNGTEANFIFRFTVNNDGDNHFTGSVRLAGWGQGPITTIETEHLYSDAATMIDALTEKAYGWIHTGWHR